MVEDERDMGEHQDCASVIVLALKSPPEDRPPVFQGGLTFILCQHQ